MGRMKLVVREKVNEAEETVSLRFLVPPEAADSFRYQAGQYVHLHHVLDGVPIERSYSFSSAPGVDADLQLTVKRIEGGVFSSFLYERLQPGDALEVSEPQGRFFDTEEAAARHVILIGAGSGVTPLYSILKWLLAQERGDRITLVFASRRESAIIFKAELDALEARYGERLRVLHVLTRPSEAWAGETGRLDRTRLAQLLRERVPAPDALPEVAYLCGPEDFMDGAAAALADRGLAARDIHRESFAVAEAASADILTPDTTVLIWPEDAEESAAEAENEALQVAIDGENHEIRLEPAETILTALQRLGIDAPFSCQEGTCLSCMCRVEEGALRMRRHDLIGLEPEDLGEGIALACLSRPQTARARISFEDV